MDKKKYHEEVLALLKPFGLITSRALFGGYGIYYEQVMFACIVDNELYFKVDECTKADYLHHPDSHPFVYEGNGKSVQMPYMTVPKKIQNESAMLKNWAQTAYEVALRSKWKKKSNVRKRRSV